jgi:farnesol dehydrogenase
MKIFITGGTGYLGQELIKALVRRNHKISALVRSPEKASALDESVTRITGSMEDRASFESRLKEHDVFVHIAALVKMWVRDRSQFDRINVQATEGAIQAAMNSGIRKFVYTSSFIALGPSNGNPLTEQDARRTTRMNNDYERTKYQADQMVRKLIQDGFPIYILYPGVIYGPGNLTDGNIVAKNLIPFLNGKMPFGLPIKTWSYAYMDDVIGGFLRVIEEDAPSHRYILGGENHSGESFYKTLQQVSGKKPPAMNIPFPLASAAGYGEYLLAQLFGREPSLLTHEVVEIYKSSWAFDSSLAQAELGYRITPLSDGLRALVDWMKKSGLIK